MIFRILFHKTVMKTEQGYHAYGEGPLYSFTVSVAEKKKRSPGVKYKDSQKRLNSGSFIFLLTSTDIALPIVIDLNLRNSVFSCHMHSVLFPIYWYPNLHQFNVYRSPWEKNVTCSTCY